MDYLSPDGLIALTFAGLCFLIIARRTKKHGTMLPVDYSILFMAMIYGISWPLIIGAIREGNAQNIHVYGKFIDSLFLNTIGAAMTVAGLLIGWTIATSVRSRTEPARSKLSISNENVSLLYGVAFWIMLAIAITSQIIYTKDYGGLFSAFEYSRFIRAGLFDHIVRSRFSFLAPFGDFALLACYGFWGLILTGRARLSVKIGFAASMLASIYVLYLAQGRLNAVAFFAILAMSALLIKSKKASSAIIFALFAVPAAAYLTFEISNYFQLKTASSFGDFYANEVSFIFSGFFAQLSNPDGLNRFFYDVATYPAYLIPSSITSGWLSDPSDLNTALIHGASKGTHGITSGMPVDIVTMGLMQMNFAGIVPYGIFYGMLMAIAYKACSSVRPIGVRASLYSYICIKIAGLGLFYAQPSTVVVGNFPIILTAIVALIVHTMIKIRPA